MSHFPILLTSAISLSSAIASSPLNLGLWVLLTALTMSFMFSMVASSWFGILLFLIYIGGMLVMFAYFIAISPNQEIRLTPMIVLSGFLFFFMLFMYYSTHIPILGFNFSSIPTNYQSLYSNTNIIILCSLGVILFLALVMVVKISSRAMGPLRPFFKYVLSHSKTTSINKNHK